MGTSDREPPSSSFTEDRVLPIDLLVVLVLVGLTDVLVLAPVTSDSWLRTIFSLLIALFLPGYAFVAALFPERGRTAAEPGRSGERTTLGRALPESDHSISGVERVLLSIGTNVVIVPLVGLLLNYTPWNIRLVPLVLSMSAFTLLAAVVAARRRRALPENERFRVPYERWLAHVRSATFCPETRADAVLNAALIVSLLVLAGSFAYTASVPKPDEQFTEFYLLTENDSGELVAGNYPSAFTPGEAKPLVVGISNREGQPTNYTVVTELQRVETRNNTTKVVEQRQLDRFRIRIGASETRLRQHTVAPVMTGSRLRLTYLLYRGAPPPNPTAENAYREIHLWISVSSGRASP